MTRQRFANLLDTLRKREVARVGAEMAESKGLPFRAAMDGESVSGKFALTEKSHAFTLFRGVQSLIASQAVR